MSTAGHNVSMMEKLVRYLVQAADRHGRAHCWGETTVKIVWRNGDVDYFDVVEKTTVKKPSDEIPAPAEVA